MNNKFNIMCERLTPTSDAKERILSHILENLDTDAASQRRTSMKRFGIAFACIGICAFGILWAAYGIGPASKTTDPPVYALVVSKDTVLLQKSPHETEQGEWMEFEGQEDAKLQSSDSGYTIAVTGGIINGQMIHLFFEITQDGEQKIGSDVQDSFSNLDLNISCKMVMGQREEVPISEWFLLEDDDPDDNRVQFGLSFWEDAEADSVDICISDLVLGSSGHLLDFGQTVSGNWNLTVPLDQEEKKSQERAQTFVLEMKIRGWKT